MSADQEPNPTIVSMQITTLAAGQPRAYADSRYCYRVDIEFQPSFTGEPQKIRWEGQNLLAKAVQYAWATRGDGCPLRFGKGVLVGYPHFPTTCWKPAWHEPRVTEAREIAPGVAEVLIVQPYLD